MKHRSLLIVLATMLSLLLAACAAATPQPEPTPTVSPISLTDGLGRSVVLDAPAQRVVSLAPSNTEILFAVGAGAQVVGRDEFSNYPPESANITSVGGSMGNYSIEQIVALTPDLVLAAEINAPELVKSLEDAGLTVFYVGNPQDLIGMYDMLLTIGTLTGRGSEAEALVSNLSVRAAAVEQKLAQVTERPTVFYQIDSSDPAKPWTAGGGTFIDTLLNQAAAENIGAAMGMPFGQMSIEALLEADPDYILLGDSNYGVTPEQVAARTGWDQLSAVKEGRVLAFNDDLISRPGPRQVEGLELLAKLLHPQLFE
ncbi:MAG: cobalamin-binding protein [Bellilinea sp.]|jgi:iron complex transport system substrate-binding protein